MKNFTMFLPVLFAGILLTGCSSDDTEPDSPPLLLTLDSEATISVPYVGGTCTIAYKIENSENKRPYVDSSCDWIAVVSYSSTQAEIKVDPIDDQSRTGYVTLSYPECEDLVVTIEQKAAGTFTESISVTAEEVTTTSATIVVSNPYEDYWVCPRVETKSFYDTQIAPDPAKWIGTYCDKKSSTGMFMSWRTYYYANYADNPQSFPEYFSISKADGNRHTFSNLKPETEYVAFGIEVDPFCIATGEIVAAEFSSAPLPPVAQVDLDFTVDASFISRSGDYCYLSVKVSPSKTDVPYFCKCFFTPVLESSITQQGGLEPYVENYLESYYPTASSTEIHTGAWTDPNLRLYTWDLTDKCTLSIVLCGCDEYGRITSEVVRKDMEIPMQ